MLLGKNKLITTDATTYVGYGMKIQGNIRCVGPIRIDGEIYGEVDCQSQVIIGPSAYIVANIRAPHTIVNGKVKGNLVATNQLEILSEGHITGNVTTPYGGLVVREGAVMEGQCFTLVPETNQSPPVEEKKLLSSSDR